MIFEVEVTVSKTYTIEVVAGSEEHAESMVSLMNETDLIKGDPNPIEDMDIGSIERTDEDEEEEEDED